MSLQAPAGGGRPGRPQRRLHQAFFPRLVLQLGGSGGQHLNHACQRARKSAVVVDCYLRERGGAKGGVSGAGGRREAGRRGTPCKALGLRAACRGAGQTLDPKASAHLICHIIVALVSVRVVPWTGGPGDQRAVQHLQHKHTREGVVTGRARAGRQASAGCAAHAAGASCTLRSSTTPLPGPPPPPLSQQHPPRSWVPVHNRVSVVRLRPVPASPRWLPCLLPPSPSPCHHNPQKHRPPTPPYQRVGRRRIKGVPPARLGAPGAGGARVVGAQRRARAPPHHEAAAGGAEGIVQLGASKGNVRSAGLQRGARGGEEGRGWMFDGGRGGEEGRGSRPCGTMRRSERQLSTCVNRSCKPTSPRPALRHARSQCTSPAAAPRTRRGHARHPPTRRAPLPLSPD